MQDLDNNSRIRGKQFPLTISSGGGLARYTPWAGMDQEGVHCLMDFGASPHFFFLGLPLNFPPVRYPG